MEIVGKIAIIMGSKSDLPKMEAVFNTLDEFKITYSVTILSAHRTPKEIISFGEAVEISESCKLVIAAAGMAAALPGSVASITSKPVIGIPLSSGGLVVNELASMLAMLQMPPGVPILTVGMDAAKNGALAAISILATSNPEIKKQYVEFRATQTSKVCEINNDLQYKKIDCGAPLKYMCT